MRNMRITRPIPGDIVKIPLPSNRICYGRIYKDATIGVYFRSAIPDLKDVIDFDPDLVAGVFTKHFKAAGWEICGHVAFENDDAAWPPPTFNRDLLSSKFQIYHRGELRPASEKDVMGLHEQLMCKPEQLAQEIDKRWI